MSKYTDILECLKIDNFEVNFIKSDITITEYARVNNKLWECWLEKYIKAAYIENTNMIDIGANIGTFSLMMSKYISKESFIYSFEPVYSEILSMNISKNKLNDRVKIFPFGLSDKKEQFEGCIIDFSKQANYGFTQLDNLKIANNKTELFIDVKKLDDLNIENVSFIKIDVEGYERKVLDGAINTIIKNTPTILIEIWCTSYNSIQNYNNINKLAEVKKQFDIFEYLFNIGYICFPVSPTSDDFLFIHHSKKELLKGIVDIL